MKILENAKNSMKVAEILIKSGCFECSTKNLFTYSSGLQGPIYCDNRKLISIVSARNQIVDCMLSVIEDNNLEFDVIAGLATGAIPFASFIAERLKKPMIYIRGETKDYGKKKQIEGVFYPEQKILVIEDLINQGKNLDLALNILEKENLDPIGSMCILNYNMKSALDRLGVHNVPLFPLTGLDNILNYLKVENFLTEAECQKIVDWRLNVSSQ